MAEINLSATPPKPKPTKEFIYGDNWNAYQRVNWLPSDICVAYNARTRRVTWSKISTGETLKSYSIDGILQNGDCITPEGIVRPYIDLSPVPFWRRMLTRFMFWIRSFKN